MCNEYLRAKAYGDYANGFAQLKLPLRFPPPHAAPNLEPQERVRPTDPAPIFRRYEDGVELAMARWWLVPWWHKGTLRDFKLATFNARSETLATSRTFRDAFARRRCLVPAEGWTEFTGTKGNKTRWHVWPRGEDWFCFAGLWDRCRTTDAGTVDSFTIVMRDPAPPLDRFHGRQPVVLRVEDWATWLDPSADARPLWRLDNADRFVVEPG